jgi:hypothetical protein
LQFFVAASTGGSKIDADPVSRQTERDERAIKLLSLCVIQRQVLRLLEHFLAFTAMVAQNHEEKLCFSIRTADAPRV